MPFTPKENSQRLMVTLPESMHEALKRQAEKKRAPMASLIRYAIESWLREQGEQVRDDIVWGGYRYSDSDEGASEEGQPMAVGVG